MSLTRRWFTGVAAAYVAIAGLPVAAAEPISVTATTGMIADVARQIGGEHVEVRGVDGPRR